MLLMATTTLWLLQTEGGLETLHGFSILRKNPDSEIQVRKEQNKIRARQASPEEKTRLWPILTNMYPTYNDYQKKTVREIPVVILEREVV
jgi:deazaflavin-dependent oxidoreductase (nitroreductase family)